MAERPPPGYEQRDKPLPHDFYYKFGLSANAIVSDNTMCTLLRTSTDAVSPSTIEVHTRNAAFAKDAGPLICADSIVQMMSVSMSISASYGAVVTDKLQAWKNYWYMLNSSWEDSWTPADELTTTTTAQLLRVISDTTLEDVRPNYTGTDLLQESGVPLSTVTDAEAFGEYGLTTDAKQESVTAAINHLSTIFDAKQYYTNGSKLNSLMGHIDQTTLSTHKLHYSRSITKFTPKNVRFGNPHMYCGLFCQTPYTLDEAQIIGESTATTAIPHSDWFIRVRFNEWNRDFNQSRK